MKSSGASEVVSVDRNKSTGDMVSTVWSPTAVSSGNSCYRFWSKRSSSEKTSISLIIFLLAIAITLSALLGVFVTWYQDISAHHDNMCTSESCVLSSASMIDRLDSSIDPCIDFYRFACGSFVKSNIPPLGRTERTALQDMQDQLYIEMKNLLEARVTHNLTTNVDHNGKRPSNRSTSIKSDSNDSSITTLKAQLFYESCMNEDAVVNGETESALALISLIQSSGGKWNLLEMMTSSPSITDNGVNLEEHIAHSAINQVQSIINFYVAPANKNASTYSVHVYPGSGILDTFYLQNVTQLGELSEEAKSYIHLQAETLRLLGHIKSGGNVSTFVDIDEMDGERRRSYEIVRQELTDMLNFESEMALLAKNYTVTDDTDESGKMLTVKDFDRKYSYLNWSNIFATVARRTNVTIDELVLSDTYSGYFDQIESLFKKHPTKLYTDFRKEVPEIADASSDPEPEFLFRWKECVHLTSETLKIPTTRLYIDAKRDYIIPVRHRTQEIVSNVRSSFNQIIRNQRWISSDQVKDQLVKRVETIETRVAFPDFLLNGTFVNRLFSQLTIDARDTLTVNMMAVAFHDSLYELSRLKKPVDTDMDWLLHPLVSNAYYDESSHSMILPIGMLQRPMIMIDRPTFLDYSTLGVVVGHELAHSLDKLTEGLFNQTLDVNANITSDASDQFISEYTNMTRCFVDQYSKYHIGNWSVDGNVTLQENICDFAGLQQSYNAFSQFYIHSLFTLPGLQRYTPQQLFFIQHAQIWCEINTEDPEQDSHSPGQFRANGVLINSKKFAAAFDCPAGSPMNPHEKCSLWSLE